MINTFKAGDKVTVHPQGEAAKDSARDTTVDKTYSLTGVADCTREPTEPQSIEFVDDVGDLVTIGCEDIVLAEE